MLSLYDLTVEYKTEPLGLGKATKAPQELFVMVEMEVRRKEYSHLIISFLFYR